MFNIIAEEIKLGDTILKIETGLMARQATSAVTITMGETVVLCTVVVNNKIGEVLDFLALTVNYQEKFYAVGKIPGGFIKRETRSSDDESLTARLIDRALRPLFPKNYHKEIQVVCTVLSYDQQNEPDVLALIGSSAAMWISGIPISEPIAGTRVNYKDGELSCNLSLQNRLKCELDLIIAGTSDSILMVESEAKEVTEDIILSAIDFGQKQIAGIVTLIKRLAEKFGTNNAIPRTQDYTAVSKGDAEISSALSTLDMMDKCLKQIHSKYFQEISDAYSEIRKKSRKNSVELIKQKVLKDFMQDGEYHEHTVLNAFERCKGEIMRAKVINTKQRIDGRGVSDIRDISCIVDVLPRTHGSALFTRGETQSLGVVTIGVTQDEQLSENLLGLKSENFILHYNFPHFSVGEVGSMRAPSRREIGHGKLAQRALRAIVPSKEEFNHTIRVVSEIFESNGSSSMASVCSISLALMAAGISTKRHVAGIAMGLIKQGEEFLVLSDIMGDEDHLGDMDLKVAATRIGITALQMDIKVTGITREIMSSAIAQALTGTNKILSIMENAICTPRKSLNKYAPRAVQIKITQDKIREVIGVGGKIIKDICLKSGAKVEIEDSGIITITANNIESIDKAHDMIKVITAEPEVGTIYNGIVTKIVDFGAFVKYFGETEGLLHISEIANTRIEKVSHYLSEGDDIKVRLIGMDRNGKSKLSMRSLEEESEETYAYKNDTGKHQNNTKHNKSYYRCKSQNDGAVNLYQSEKSDTNQNSINDRGTFNKKAEFDSHRSTYHNKQHKKSYENKQENNNSEMGDDGTIKKRRRFF